MSLLWTLALIAEGALVARVEAACASIDATLRPTVRVAESTDEFIARTGRPRFDAAASVGEVIWLQPVKVLDRLPELDGVLRHECVHVMLRARRVTPIDRIWEEAIALELSGQAARLAPAPVIAPPERAAINAALVRPKDRASYERALARAASTHGAQIRAWRRDGVLVEALLKAADDRRSGSAR